jgi:hypothetical protein
VEAGIFQKAIQSTGNMANSKQDIKDQKEIPKMPKAMRERLELELKNHAKHKAEVQAQQKAAKKKEHTKSNGNNVSSGKDGEPEKLERPARKVQHRVYQVHLQRRLTAQVRIVFRRRKIRNFEIRFRMPCSRQRSRRLNIATSYKLAKTVRLQASQKISNTTRQSTPRNDLKRNRRHLSRIRTQEKLGKYQRRTRRGNWTTPHQNWHLRFIPRHPKTIKWL